MTWTAYGRPNTSTNQPGQFVFAGTALSHDPAPPGLSVNRPAEMKIDSFQADPLPPALTGR